MGTHDGKGMAALGARCECLWALQHRLRAFGTHFQFFLQFLAWHACGAQIFPIFPLGVPVAPPIFLCFPYVPHIRFSLISNVLKGVNSNVQKKMGG